MMAANVFKRKLRSGKKSGIWYGKIREGSRPYQTWRVVPLFSDKTASERELQKLQALADRRAQGMITPETDAAAKPLADHVADYLASLKQSGVDSDHLRIVTWMTERLLELSGWKRVADLTADSLRMIVARVAAEGKATSYCNRFISRAKAFVHWMQANQRLTSDPFAGVKRGNVNRGKRTRSRRALVDEELKSLLAAAPADRRRKYLFAALSGLRRGELGDLRWGDLRLKAPIPFVQLRQDQTKNQKADAIPLHPALLSELVAMTPGEDDDRVLGSMPDMKSMAKDLLAAGIARRDDENKIIISDSRGRRADFHALRHTFKSNVDRVGCTQAVSDALTRHGDKTVADGYRHAELSEMLDALRQIPDPSPTEIGTEKAVKTGTHDGPAHQIAHHGPVDDVRALATTGGNLYNAPIGVNVARTNGLAMIGDDRLEHAGSGGEFFHDVVPVQISGPSTQAD
jgi:integrase